MATTTNRLAARVRLLTFLLTRFKLNSIKANPAIPSMNQLAVMGSFCPLDRGR